VLCAWRVVLEEECETASSSNDSKQISDLRFLIPNS